MDEPNIFEEIVRLRAAGRRAALATVVRVKGSAPRHEAARLLVREDGSTLGTVGGALLEADVIRAGARCLASGRPEYLTFDLTAGATGMICGGTVDVFVDMIGSPPRFLVFGAGHISHALVPMLKLVGLKVTVVDDRPDMLTLERFPDADGMIVKKPADAFRELEPDPTTGIAILNRSHEEDKAVLRWAVMTEASYVGMIGSRAKVAALFSALAAEGTPDERLKRVRAPIGLPIGAETPAEIALSIAAEIVAHYRGDRPAGKNS